MKKTILEQAVRIISSTPGVQKEEFYFLLASYIMYFNSPLNKETWNTFTKKVEQKKITTQEAIFTTDEEKNPDFFKKITKTKKSEIKDIIFGILCKTKSKLENLVPFSNTEKNVVDEIILIPDVINPSTECTIFPKTYLRKMIENGTYINELTGHPLAWHIVDAIKTGKDIYNRTGKKVSSNYLLGHADTELEKLNRITQCCIVCKCSNPTYKSIYSFQCVFFCSLKCMEKWEN